VIVRGMIEVPKASVLARTTALHVPFFPASPTLVALLLAIVLLGIWAVMALERRRPMSDTNPLVTLGRASLTLLLVHVWLFREATRPIGVWQALGLSASTAVLIGFIVFAVVATRLWQKYEFKFGAEWLLRKLAP
jgi:fucose 4-O-acetylase-like acetyltransferase